MKKIISLLLVVLLLGTVTAFAEDATYYAFSDPVLDLQFGEDPVHLDLNGLSLAVAPLEVNDEQVIAFNILGDGAPLFVAAFRIAGDQFLVDVDGWTHTYSAAIPAVQAADDADQNPFENIDMEALVGKLMSEMELSMKGDTVTFTIPYTAVNSLMQELLPAFGESISLPEGMDFDANDVAAAFAEMEKTDSGVTLSGSYTQKETETSAALDCFLVQEGQTMEAPVVSMSFHMSDVLSFDIDAADVSIHFSIDSNTGILELRYTASEQSVFFSGKLESGEGELTLAELGDPATAVDVQNLTDEQSEELGNETMQAAGALLNYLAPVLNSVM